MRASPSSRRRIRDRRKTVSRPKDAFRAAHGDVNERACVSPQALSPQKGTDSKENELLTSRGIVAPSAGERSGQWEAEEAAVLLTMISIRIAVRIASSTEAAIIAEEP